jgi:putative ABC transport system permease protein
MRALQAKLGRDLRRLVGPAFAIAAIVACGIMAWVALRGTAISLRSSRDAFYARTRFGDITARVVRAPIGLTATIARFPGVARVDTRIDAQVTVHVRDFDDPVRLTATSLPDDPTMSLSLVVPTAGALPGSGEVLVGEAFAIAHDLKRGDTLDIAVNGVARRFVVSGRGASPDAVYVLASGTLWPDDERTGVLWMSRAELEGPLQMRGAFTELVVGLEPGASVGAVEEVKRRLDELLGPWGTPGAIARDQQTSHRFVNEELQQVESQTTFVPGLFLLVSAFILHNVLSRLLQTEREIIALLKAVGYRRLEIAAHYMVLGLVVVFVGAVLGVIGGVAGTGLFVDLYRDYFRFDRLEVVVDTGVVLTGVVAALAAGVAGAWRAIAQATSVPPATAMQPPTPPVFGRGLLERVGVLGALSVSGRMIARTLLRRPLRSAVSILGLGLAGAIVVVASVMFDAMAVIIDLGFRQEAREDLAVGFVGVRPRAALDELKRIPGVLRVEGERMVPVRVRGVVPMAWEGVLIARDDDAELTAPLDRVLRRARRPVPGGVTLTDELARRLGVRVGDVVEVVRIDDPRTVRRLPVTGLSEEALGLGAVVTATTMRAFCGDGGLVTGARLQVDPRALTTILSDLRRRPGVAGATAREASLAAFQRLMGDTVAVTRALLAFFASVIAIGIVYNNGRIALAEQARDLATLRVLGFTRREIAALLLGGEAVIVLLSVPVSWVLGRILTGLLLDAVVASDLIRFPLVTNVTTYVSGSAVVVVAALVTALFIRRRVDRLDLVAVLKARE